MATLESRQQQHYSAGVVKRSKST